MVTHLISFLPLFLLSTDRSSNPWWPWLSKVSLRIASGRSVKNGLGGCPCLFVWWVGHKCPPKHPFLMPLFPVARHSRCWGRIHREYLCECLFISRYSCIWTHWVPVLGAGTQQVHHRLASQNHCDSTKRISYWSMQLISTPRPGWLSTR